MTTRMPFYTLTPRYPLGMAPDRSSRRRHNRGGYNKSYNFSPDEYRLSPPKPWWANIAIKPFKRWEINGLIAIATVLFFYKESAKKLYVSARRRKDDREQIGRAIAAVLKIGDANKLQIGWLHFFDNSQDIAGIRNLDNGGGEGGDAKIEDAGGVGGVGTIGVVIPSIPNREEASGQDQIIGGEAPGQANAIARLDSVIWSTETGLPPLPTSSSYQ